MKLVLEHIEQPLVFRLENESGSACLLDAAPSSGGQNKGLRPMELVAGGLAGCIAIDVLLMLKKQREPSDHFRISIEAGRREGIPSPFEFIHLVIEADDAVDKQRLDKDVRLALDKYCSVAASLRDDIRITFQIN